MNFEEAVIKAIADSFFQTYPGGTGPNGEVYFSPSPALGTAQRLFDARKDDILAAVIAHLDVDELAEKMAAPLLRALVETPGQFSPHRFHDDKFNADLRAAVIERVAAAQAEQIMERCGEEPTGS